MAEPITETSKVLLNVGPWVISIIAFAQVWLIALYKRFRKPKIEVYETSNLEIGFSRFGPTIAVIGTLRTIYRDAFIKGMRLTLRRKKDNASHVFHWRAFRSNTISLNLEHQPPIEIAASFLLAPDRPLKFNIFFVDDAFIAELSPVTSELAAKFFEFRKTLMTEMKEKIGDEYQNIISHPIFMEKIYEDFATEQAHVDTYAALDRAFYWEAGDYELDMTVESSDPKFAITKTKAFSLSDEDSNALRLNIIGVLRQICGIIEPLSFANPKYKD